MAPLILVLLAVATAVGHAGDAVASPDKVTSLPGYGPVRTVQYAGLVPINSTYNKQLFYWFVEASNGNEPGKTPLLIWMNGGPGASSLTGLLAENIGPITLQMDNSGTAHPTDNPDTWARSYNVLAIDNPVGAGFSYTNKGGWVTTEEEMRREYYAGLSGFFSKHPEYRTNPIWVAGESYGGKYVPNVAYEIYQREELNLKGVMIGNGMFRPVLQYAAVPEYAYNQGIIDDHAYKLSREKIGICIDMIKAGKNAEAKVYCEATVDWIYGANETGAGQFYYDIGMADGTFFNDLTTAMGNWLNSPETKKALHVGDLTWVQSDETGPVADALVDDFVTDQSMKVLSALLKADKFEIVTYNGVRDGSLCNHVGHLRSMEAVEWSGQLHFNEAANEPFRVDGIVAGFKRSFSRLTFFTLLRTGHLVPTVVPKVALAMIDSIVGHGADTAAKQAIVV